MQLLKVIAFLSIVIAATACGQVAVEPDDDGAEPPGDDRGTDDDGGDEPADPPDPPPGDPPPEPIITFELIDDLEDGDGYIQNKFGRVGYWWTANDGTGQQEPAPKDLFTPSTGGADGSLYMAVTTGSGFTDWGASLGLYFNATNEDALPSTYDIFVHTGLHLQIQKGATPIRLMVITADLLREADGGRCIDGSSPDDTCEDYYGIDIPGDGGDWQEHALRFDEMEQAGWGQDAPFDRGKAIGIEIYIPPGSDFKIDVDNVQFYNETEG